MSDPRLITPSRVEEDAQFEAGDYTGSLQTLAALGPDYLGFRGALCAGGRANRVELERVRQVRQALEAASSATAAAGALMAAASRTSGAPSTSSAKSR